MSSDTLIVSRPTRIIALGGLIMQRKLLQFSKGLYAEFTLLEKRLTIRKFRPEAHLFQEGEVFLGQFEDGPTVELRATADTLRKPLRDVSDAEAREDGCYGAADLRAGLGADDPDLADDTEIAIIRFDCTHAQVKPAFNVNAVADLPPEEIRRIWPRFEGVCPDCQSQLILYASAEHYTCGDW
jgi:hypothetical protein